jgi:hypothetical protein
MPDPTKARLGCPSLCAASSTCVCARSPSPWQAAFAQLVATSCKPRPRLRLWTWFFLSQFFAAPTGFFANFDLGFFLALGMQLFANSTALVEHFKFFSERVGEKCPLFFTLFFSLKKQVKNFENIKHFLVCFKIFTLKRKRLLGIR